MSVPSTSSERSTVANNNHGHLQQQAQQVLPHQHDMSRQAEYNQAAVAVATASGMMGGGHGDEANQFHPHQHHFNVAMHYQQQAQQAQQAQLQQYQLLQQQQLQQQQLHHHHLQPQIQQLPHPQQLQHLQQHTLHLNDQVGGHPSEFESGQFLTSKYMENEIIKTFPSKPELVKFVKSTLNEEEQCKIVINSSKPKAVYFQCERSGSFRTTVKDSTKRQRVAYTKRNKCGYRLVANLYPPDKDKKRVKKLEDGSLDKDIDDKLNDFEHENSLSGSGEIWILRMIHPQHNHPPEPTSSSKKKRSKFTRTLVEKPLNRGSASNNAGATYNDIVAQSHAQIVHPAHQHQVHITHPHHQLASHAVQDPAVIAAMEGAPNADAAEVAAAAAAAMHHQHAGVDPNIDPNVDPSVQEHDHAHNTLR